MHLDLLTVRQSKKNLLRGNVQSNRDQIAFVSTLLKFSNEMLKSNHESVMIIFTRLTIFSDK